MMYIWVCPCLSVGLSLWSPLICLFACLSIYPSICVFECLSVCSSLSPCLCLSIPICVSVHLSTSVFQWVFLTSGIDGGPAECPPWVVCSWVAWLSRWCSRACWCLGNEESVVISGLWYTEALVMVLLVVWVIGWWWQQWQVAREVGWWMRWCAG